MINTVLPILAAYLLGAVPAGFLIARRAGIRDIRSRGSGNIGATNVWRVVGGKAAAWVFAVDVGKAMLAMVPALLVTPTWFTHETLCIMCACAVVLGNIFSVFLRFRGGKGVNTALGALLVLMPWQVLICFGVFVVVVAVSRLVSLGSIISTTSLALILMMERYMFDYPVHNAYLTGAVLIALVVLFSHRKNIMRIIAGTEHRLPFSWHSRKA
jgi:glycerol-3-phosphate acyltransferase PlsY